MVEWEAHLLCVGDITRLNLGFATNSCNWCFTIFLSPFRKMGSQDSLVSTVMLPAGISRVHILAGARDFYILQKCQTGCGPHPLCCHGCQGSFPDVKWFWCEVDHWHLLLLRLRMSGAVLLPLYDFMVWSGICLPPPLLPSPIVITWCWPMVIPSAFCPIHYQMIILPSFWAPASVVKL